MSTIQLPTSDASQRDLFVSVLWAAPLPLLQNLQGSPLTMQGRADVAPPATQSLPICELVGHRYVLDIVRSFAHGPVRKRLLRSAMNNQEPPMVGRCYCGCGKATNKHFAGQGHDLRAKSFVIRQEYGSIARFLVDHGYEPNGKRASNPD